MNDYKIVSVGELEVQAIHTGLRSYNRRFVPDMEDLSLAVINEAGQVIGGCDVFRMGELAMLDVLWIAEEHRGAGLGGYILHQLEEKALRQGAKRMELNTFGFQAPGFYEKLGYRRFGAIEPAVGTYGHYFYVKDLT